MYLFKTNNTIQTYTYPVLRIACCIIILIITFLLIIKPDYTYGTFGEIIIRIIALLIVVLSLVGICISINEIILLNDRRTKASINIQEAANQGEFYSVNKIISCLESNDCIELIAILDDQLISIGAASDTKPGSNRFFDKEYFVNDTYYQNIEEIKTTLINFSDNNNLYIILIDGLSPSNFKLP